MQVIIPEGGFKPNEKVCCIYRITNVANGKVYIGQTTDYRKRSSAHRRAIINCPDGLAITKAMVGHDEDFVMEIIHRCDPDDNLTALEDYYIVKYDAMENGYNTVHAAPGNDKESRRNKSLAHIGLTDANDTKRKKSNTIYAIKDNQFIIADSGKLFGDYVDVSKDLIKNCLRQPSRIQGYQLYYADYDKRHAIADKFLLGCPGTNRTKRNKEYIPMLEIVDRVDKEGVETIYSSFEVYTLSYDNVDFIGELYLKKISV